MELGDGRELQGSEDVHIAEDISTSCARSSTPSDDIFMSKRDSQALPPVHELNMLALSRLRSHLMNNDTRTDKDTTSSDNNNISSTDLNDISLTSSSNNNITSSDNNIKSSDNNITTDNNNITSSEQKTTQLSIE